MLNRPHGCLDRVSTSDNARIARAQESLSTPRHEPHPISIKRDIIERLAREDSPPSLFGSNPTQLRKQGRVLALLWRFDPQVAGIDRNDGRR